jgi:hypothetical protein
MTVESSAYNTRPTLTRSIVTTLQRSLYRSTKAEGSQSSVKAYRHDCADRPYAKCVQNVHETISNIIPRSLQQSKRHKISTIFTENSGS